MYRNGLFQYKEKFMKIFNLFKSNIETVNSLKHNSNNCVLFQDDIKR